MVNGAETEDLTFTRYLERVAKGEDLAEALPPVRRALGRLLARELKRRGMWDKPPNYLGVFGVDSWDRPGAIEDLAAECYAFVFVDRLEALLDHLEVKPNVEGLVPLNVRNFLHDKQKEHDPLGYRVFNSVRTAVVRAVKAGDVTIVAGDPRVRNETVLGFPGPPAVEGDAEGGAEEEVNLEPVVRSWNDSLLPELITAHGRGRQPVLEELGRRLLGLPKAGVRSCRFREILDPLKEDARKRWGAILEHDHGNPEKGEEGEAPPTWTDELLRHDRRFAEADTFLKLVDCVDELTRRVEASRIRRRYLMVLWAYLRTAVATDAAEDRSRISYRRMGETLNIPREQLPDLFTLLGELVQRCRGMLGTGPRSGRSASGEPSAERSRP